MPFAWKNGSYLKPEFAGAFCDLERFVRAAHGMTRDQRMLSQPHQRNRRPAPAHSRLWGALTPEESGALNAIMRRKKIAAGQVYVIEGDDTRDFGTVISGVGKLVRDAEDGRSQIVGLLFASDFVAGAFAGQGVGREPYTIEAVSTMKLSLFPRDQLETLLRKYPSLERRMLDHALDELRITRDWMVLLGRKTASERVASFLLYVAGKMQRSGAGQTAEFDLPLGRADIADFIGLTIETVSRQMTRLKRDGVLEMSSTKHVVRLDSEGLRRRAGF